MKVDNGSGRTIGAIVGISVGTLLMVGVGIYCMRRSHQRN